MSLRSKRMKYFTQLNTEAKAIGFSLENLVANANMQNEEICREVIETLLHIKVGKLVYKSFEKELKLEPDKRGIRLDVYVADSGRVFDLEMQNRLRLADFRKKVENDSQCTNGD